MYVSSFNAVTLILHLIRINNPKLLRVYLFIPFNFDMNFMADDISCIELFSYNNIVSTFIYCAQTLQQSFMLAFKNSGHYNNFS